MNEQIIKTLEDKNKHLEEQLNIISSRIPKPNLYDDLYKDEVDLIKLWKILWDGKWLTILITLVFSISSVFYAMSIPNEYKATAILAPVAKSTSSLSKLAGQFGGIASLAGVNLGGSNNEDKSLIAMEIIKTWGFLEKFIKKNSIEVEVFAITNWNKANDQLIINENLYDKKNKKWVREFDPQIHTSGEPTSWELYEKIKDRIYVNQSSTTGLISLSVEYYSPLLAKEWVDKLIVMINQHFRLQDRRDALKSIEYLNKQINKTNITEMQTVFYQLIEEQTQTLMLAEISEEYVLKTVSSAMIPEEKSKPRRAVICLLITFLGFVLGVVTVFFRSYITTLKDNKI